MPVSLKRVYGRKHITNEAAECGYDEILLDGEKIGLSFVGANSIVYMPHPKKEIPKSVRREAVQLCKERNQRHAIAIANFASPIH